MEKQFNMETKKIVFMGSKDIGYECLFHLYREKEKFGYAIVGVLTNNRGDRIKEFCRRFSIKIINGLDNYLEIPHVDIGLSVQYHEILKSKHIEKAKQITVNVHMAPLPEYRGCNQFSFAIINNEKEFGTTIHRLEEGIDSGDIIFERRFPIPPSCWVNDLYQITFDHTIKLFEKSLPQLITGAYELKSQDSFLNKRSTSTHYRKEINDIKNINISWNQEKILRHIRATSMAGFEPPYTIVNNQKIYLCKDYK